MSRLSCYLLCTTIISSLMGCAMCCGPYDDDYNVFGGKYQRADPAHGRVGSRLSDPYHQPTGPAANSNLALETPLRIIGDDEGLSPDEREQRRIEMENMRRDLDINGNELPEPNSRSNADGNDTAGGRPNPLRSRSGRRR